MRKVLSCCLVLIGLAAGLSPASAAGSAAPTAIACYRENFEHCAWRMPWDWGRNLHQVPFTVRSLRNESKVNLCGTNLHNTSLQYTFWAGHNYDYIGWPFSEREPLDGLQWC